ncbi:TPA: hypothetical protein N0F65_001602 [Lagenidium giganteum]|uniref:Uncharacterized protein n=1 Tax=Lagenidium giganteum TaxID=4803 RepID=A0AAV2Z1U3_9STRA|nr:TPA: hypothetical protein N0F65_001602 [Lagenidium giganteum]
MFEKEFTHETMEQLMERTWQVSTDIKHVRKLQPSFRQMKLLQRLNDDTMVFARNFSFPHDDTNFCSIFLLFRLETETGYIIGTRTLRPLCSNDVLERVLGKKVSFVHLFYSFLFDRLPSSSTNQSDGEQSGCVVRFGGRVGNGTKMYAHTCALDVLLVCLRWESYCVRPLYRLSAGVEACNEEPEFKGDDTKRYHISDVPSISKGETENQPILSII